ncbi:MAG: hypothetical protein HOQ24_11335, partial [Mycobacteriaceae bacterium]|nr:hypothetical protein [Mycobacteriaceae bacterium]
DGRAVLTAAAASPSDLVVDIDANAAGMFDASRRAARPAKRGGLANALFVVASAERLPSALDGVADIVTVYFPWGSLLRGLVTGDPAMLSGLARTMKPGAALTVVLSVIDHDRTMGLPAVDAAALTALADSYAAAGLAVSDIAPATRQDIAATGSSWGKRLGAGAERPAWRITAART